jgi:hypothetical protein
MANQDAGSRLRRFILAAIIYGSFAIYLYSPYLEKFRLPQCLLIVNVCLASLGCFVLSRRWVSSFAGSFFAGAIYGFGPYVLGLAKFHPTAGFLAAVIPWFFCPAAFIGKNRWRWAALPLSALPFLAILLFFRVSAHYGLFAVPIQTRLRLADLLGLFAPLVAANRNLVPLGFCHVPVAPLLMGFAMLLAARRIGIIAIFCLGTVPAFCSSFFGVSPIVWLSIPAVCCSVLVGAGVQGLASAGFADRKWVLLISIILGTFAIAALFLATKYFQIFLGLAAEYARLFTQTGKMYILGAVAVGIIFFIIRAKLRVTVIRLIILSAAMAIDIFFSARFIVDKIL